MNTKVYLAGNMHSDWRRVVIDALEGYDVTFLCPRNTPDIRMIGGGNKDLYFLRDKYGIRQADVIFGNIEKYNSHSRHVGLAAELGMSYVLGKIILLVNSLSDVHSFEFLEKLADSTFPTLEDGIRALEFVILDNQLEEEG